MLFHRDLVGIGRMFGQNADPLRLAYRDDRIFQFAIGPLAQFDAKPAAFLARRIKGRIGENHQRRLQSFRAVHGHQTHFIAALDLLALDFDIATVKPIEEALQGRDMVALECECRRQQFVERVDRRVAKTRQQFAPALHRPGQYRLEKLVRRVKIGHRQQLHQRFDLRAQFVLPAQEFPEAFIDLFRPAMTACQQVLLGPAEQWRHQQTGKIEIVIRLQHETNCRQQVLDNQRLVQPDTVDSGHRYFLGKQTGNDERAQLIALAHQNQDILRLQRSIFPVQPERICWRQPSLDLHRQLLGKHAFLLARPGFLILVITIAGVGNRLP